jgi:hypothetical protein
MEGVNYVESRDRAKLPVLNCPGDLDGRAIVVRLWNAIPSAKEVFLFLANVGPSATLASTVAVYASCSGESAAVVALVGSVISGTGFLGFAYKNFSN